jgi:outer membrane protein assembly factor BamB
MPRTFLLSTFFLSVLMIAHAAAGSRGSNWPCWRGPRGDGTSLESGVPVHWDGPAGKNIAWKVPISAAGHASPIVWEDRVFVVGCREERPERVLLCLDRKTGKSLWQRVVANSPLEGKHPLNSFASSTPATDGKQVYATFLDRGQMLVAAYDLAGNARWTARPGEFHSVHGYCSSVVLYKDLVILNGDHDGDAYLVALERATGRTVWKIPRENRTRSYCVPIIRQLDGRTQLIVSGNKCVASYDPRDGSRHWIIDGPTEQFVASMVDNGKLLFMTAGYPDHHIFAIRPDGRGNVTESHVVWRTRKGCSYVPSPIATRDGRYFLVVSDEGMASCFDAQSGKRHWMERIGPHYSPSLVSAEGLVHFLSDDGVTTIVRPGTTFDVVARNPLGEGCRASPAISQGQILIRGLRHLVAIGLPAPPASPNRVSSMAQPLPSLRSQ